MLIWNIADEDFQYLQNAEKYLESIRPTDIENCSPKEFREWNENITYHDDYVYEIFDDALIRVGIPPNYRILAVSKSSLEVSD